MLTYRASLRKLPNNLPHIM
uniref:Uncharacterized protein n=1 Tax=Anguilla anguilla TaxID=7936 RepID=A0A0E9V9E8_ANGAN